MRKIAVFVPILLLAVLVLVGAGCGEKEAEEGVVPLGEQEEEEEEVESLTEILGKAIGISSLKYDMVVTPPGEAAVTTTMWRRGE
ncbi:unnamed protein product, partial [marine sediment metagenome]